MISVRITIAVLLGTITALLSGLGYVTWWQVHITTLRAQAEARRYDALALSATLGRSSAQLDRATFLYVATGNPLYRRHFREILAIRDGTAPRPRDYRNPFRHRPIAQGDTGGEYGPPSSLLAIMKTSHLATDEFAALAKALHASDARVRQQISIMDAAARRHHGGGAGSRTPLEATPTQLLDQTYRTQSDSIGRNIENFRRLVDWHTRERLAALRVRSARFSASQIAFFSLLLLVSGAAFLISERGLVRPLRSLTRLTRRIAAGDYGQRVGHHNLLELQRLGGTFNTMAEAIQRDIARRDAAEKQAMEARLEAERATRAKSAFVANTSHEIRTPLNAVIGMAELLRESRLDADQRDSVDIIHSSSEHLLAVINDVLDFSKIESGMLELAAHPFDLDDAVEDVLEWVAVKAQEKDLDLTYEIAPGTPMRPNADAARVRQILVNYLSNAVKFTSHGAIVVAVSATALAGKRFRFHLSVRDSGTGIAPEHIHQLFKPFSQIDVSTARPLGGTGLGLAICKRLAELMGGDVAVESRPDTGSTFSFTFVADAEEESLKTRWPGIDGLAGKRLLIVDPHDGSRRVLRRLAVDWGLRVADYATARQALSRLRRGGRFDLVAIDDTTPDMAGAEPARRLREQAKTVPPPRFLLLGKLRTSWCKPPGYDAVLHKPLRRKATFNAFVSMLCNDPSPTADPPASRPAAPANAFRILVAEDNAINRKIVLRMLQALGYDADWAEDGAAAVAAAGRTSYDLVLMDVQMPTMDGLAATRRIRQLPLARQPLICAMTASALDRERRACIAAGMDHHIAKPIRKRQLGGLLRQLRERQVAIPSSPAPETRVDDTVAADAIQRLVDDLGRAGAVDILQAMAGGAERACARLNDACGSGDLLALRRQAHALRSNCTMIGGLALADDCARLDATMRASSEPPLPAASQSIAHRYALLMRGLQPWIERLQSADPL